MTSKGRASAAEDQIEVKLKLWSHESQKMAPVNSQNGRLITWPSNSKKYSGTYFSVEHKSFSIELKKMGQ